MSRLLKRSILATFVGACTAGASADFQPATGLELHAVPFLASANGAFPDVDVDLSGRVHNNLLNSEWNNVIRLDLEGTHFQVTGIAWDLEATTRHGIALSELRFAVFNADGEGVVFNPFEGNASVGTGQALASVYDLTGPGLAFDAPTGEVFIELYLPRNVSLGAEAWYSPGSALRVEYATVPQINILQTGFEPPMYSPGDINGQNGWVIMPADSQGMVQLTTVHSGDQALDLSDADSYGCARHDAHATLTDELVRADFDIFVPFEWGAPIIGPNLGSSFDPSEPVKLDRPDIITGEHPFKAQMRLEFHASGETFGVEFGLITTPIEYNGLPPGSTANYIEVIVGDEIVRSCYSFMDYPRATDAWAHYWLSLSPAGNALLYRDGYLVASVTGFGQLENLSTVEFLNQRLGAGPFDNASICFDNLTLSVGGQAPCNGADLAVPFGAFDFSDALVFLSAFEAQSPVADMAEPFGVLNYSDVIVFLSSFDDGCP